MDTDRTAEKAPVTAPEQRTPEAGTVAYPDASAPRSASEAPEGDMTGVPPRPILNSKPASNGLPPEEICENFESDPEPETESQKNIPKISAHSKKKKGRTKKPVPLPMEDALNAIVESGSIYKIFENKTENAIPIAGIAEQFRKATQPHCEATHYFQANPARRKPRKLAATQRLKMPTVDKQPDGLYWEVSGDIETADPNTDLSWLKEAFSQESHNA